MINNCLDKIARKANVDEITKIQKLDKYVQNSICISKT